MCNLAVNLKGRFAITNEMLWHFLLLKKMNYIYCSFPSLENEQDCPYYGCHFESKIEKKYIENTGQ